MDAAADLVWGWEMHQVRNSKCLHEPCCNLFAVP